MLQIKNNHAVSEIGYHLVWCTKFRHPVLKGFIEVETKKILAQTCITYGWKCPSVEVMPDHVHMYITCNHTIAPYQIVQALKSISAIYIFEKFPKLKGQKFWGTGLWSLGCYYSTVGKLSEQKIIKYISTQKTR